MIRPWTRLDPDKWEILQTIVSFLEKRLAEQGTLDWALVLKPEQRIERMAVMQLLTGPGERNLAEPWASAWRLIEESWAEPHLDEHNGNSVYDVQRRLRTGDRSGAAIAAIVDLVAPRLKVRPRDAWRWRYIKKPRKPKMVRHILDAGLTSGDLVDLKVLELAKIDDFQFLMSLAIALEGAINRGLEIARRLGWDGHGQLLQLGGLERAYYVTESPRALENRDPDAYHHGVAPAVKLLHSVVVKISGFDPAAAWTLARRLRLVDSPVHLRLWAAVSRNEKITPPEEVADCLAALDQNRFWDLQGFPEIAELRAIRFRDMDEQAQKAVVARIQKGPPRERWQKKANTAEMKEARLFSSLRELRRIEVGGGVLPNRVKAWLSARSAQFAGLAELTIAEGFSRGISVTYREARPDAKLDTVSGLERLKTLEAALETGRRGWDDDPAERANDWICEQGNVIKVLADFESTNNGGDDFPKVWDRFGWAHRPSPQDGSNAQDAQLGEEAGRVLDLLNRASDVTFSSAIEGICAWLDAWGKHAVKLPLAGR